MKKYKSVQEVIRQGHIRINLVVIIIQVISILLSVLIVNLFFSSGTIIIGIFIGILLGTGIAWCWWSYQIVKWRIWAFRNTTKSDWIKLKQESIKQKLIWADGNKYEKTEYRSKIEQELITGINVEIDRLKNVERIKKKEEYEKMGDNAKIPTEMRYYYSNLEIVLSFFIPLVLFSIGIYLFVEEDYLIGILSLIMSFFNSDIQVMRNVFGKRPQLILNSKEIFVAKSGYDGLDWKNIDDFELEYESYELKIFLLQNEEPYDVIEVKINELGIKDLDRFLATMYAYKKRYIREQSIRQK